MAHAHPAVTIPPRVGGWVKTFMRALQSEPQACKSCGVHITSAYKTHDLQQARKHAQKFQVHANDIFIPCQRALAHQ